MSMGPRLIARINAFEGIVTKDSLPEDQPKQAHNLRIVREAPPHPSSCVQPSKSSNNRKISEYAHHHCCPGLIPDHENVQPWSFPARKRQGGNEHRTSHGDPYENWCPIRKENFRQYNLLRVEQRMKTLLGPSLTDSEVRRRVLAQSRLEGEAWIKLDKDGNEDWIAVGSEKGDVDDWVDLGLRGEVCQRSGSGEAKEA